MLKYTDKNGIVFASDKAKIHIILNDSYVKKEWKGLNIKVIYLNNKTIYFKYDRLNLVNILKIVPNKQVNSFNWIDFNNLEINLVETKLKNNHYYELVSYTNKGKTYKCNRDCNHWITL